jgi:lipopolysaccharide transport system ATP-binding protein
MSRSEIDTAFDSIVKFAGVGDFIDQPVKTYSSGMYVRLAFSVAINVDPDILVIDEALAVGDGEFSRKSFDRIMEMKKSGKTILFCSHALYQVEAICDSVIWIKEGNIAKAGSPADVVMAYNDYLSAERREAVSLTAAISATQPEPPDLAPQLLKSTDTQECIKKSEPADGTEPRNTASIKSVKVCVDGEEGKHFCIEPLKSDLNVTVSFRCPRALPSPNVAVCFVRQDGQIVASSATHLDDKPPERIPEGGFAQVCFPSLPLLKGMYQLDVYLMCEDGIHVYDTVNMAATLEIRQKSLELGVVSLPHKWI